MNHDHKGQWNWTQKKIHNNRDRGVMVKMMLSIHINVLGFFEGLNKDYNIIRFVILLVKWSLGDPF